jgi:hypothetical protein
MTQSGRTRLISLMVGAATILTFAGAPSAGAATPTFAIVQPAQVPLAGARTWVLQGVKLPDGWCRYSYPSQPVEIPAAGWALRSIAIDMRTCRKLMEEGTPTAAPPASDEQFRTIAQTIGGDAPTGPSATASSALASGVTSALAVSSTKGAWLFIGYRDPVNLLLTADVTQINWVYNGSTVSSGTTTGVWKLFTPTNWHLDFKTLTQLFGPGASYYRGQTTSQMSNDICPGDTLTYTKYFYNRVWGHPNGTATRDYSSDAVNECLPFGFDLQSAYGQYPGT